MEVLKEAREAREAREEHSWPLEKRFRTLCETHSTEPSSEPIEKRFR